jgi:hypothetical protein
MKIAKKSRGIAFYFLPSAAGGVWVVKFIGIRNDK